MHAVQVTEQPHRIGGTGGVAPRLAGVELLVPLPSGFTVEVPFCAACRSAAATAAVSSGEPSRAMSLTVPAVSPAIFTAGVGVPSSASTTCWSRTGSTPHREGRAVRGRVERAQLDHRLVRGACAVDA